MTTTENTKDNITVSPLMGAIVMASVQQAEDATDLLLENKDREIAEWKAAFSALFDAVQSANESVDSVKICRIVGNFSQKREWAVPDTDFR